MCCIALGGGEQMNKNPLFYGVWEDFEGTPQVNFRAILLSYAVNSG